MSKTKLYALCGLILLILSYIAIRGYYIDRLENRLRISEQNYKAAVDSLDIIKLSNNNLLYEKQAYIMNETELINKLNMSKSEIKELKKQLKSDIDYISNINGDINIDTILMKDTVYCDSAGTKTIEFEYLDPWLKMKGRTELFKDSAKTNIHNINIPLQLQTGLTEDHNIFVKTNNPYVTITGIDGARLNVNKTKLEIKHGVHLGVGIQYGLLYKNFDLGPQVGYGITIKF